ncbi:MAG: ribosome-associated translation inhibitor RaiA [Bryobacteraceae bacterium]|nr:ribosome-associated translation inhibitor RaiA [Bryobacteraceae bacterium]
MKVTYKGKLDILLPAQRKKLEAKLAKLGKLVDGRDEREAHVILNSERHLHRAEITINFHDHPLVGVGDSADLLSAVTTAVDKLEKQVRKLRTKWRDTKRGPEMSLRSQPGGGPESEAAEAEAEAPAERSVYRVNSHSKQKPMTLDEALLRIEDGRDYVVYRDAETDRLSVLVRRRDGNFDLVEA